MLIELYGHHIPGDQCYIGWCVQGDTSHQYNYSDGDPNNDDSIASFIALVDVLEFLDEIDDQQSILLTSDVIMFGVIEQHQRGEKGTGKYKSRISKLMKNHILALVNETHIKTAKALSGLEARDVYGRG